MRCRLAAAVCLAGIGAGGQAWADTGTALEFAACAGVADAQFELAYRDVDDPKVVNDIADEAHIFHLLARQELADASAVLHLERVRARDRFLGLSDDDERHGAAQFCSDLRQELDGDGRFVDPLDGR